MTEIFHTAHLQAAPRYVEQYKVRLLAHARNSLMRENGGCLRFDVHQNTEDPTLFLLIEVYRDAEAFEAHRASVHFREYREDTSGWVTGRSWWYWNPLDNPPPA